VADQFDTSYGGFCTCGNGKSYPVSMNNDLILVCNKEYGSSVIISEVNNTWKGKTIECGEVEKFFFSTNTNFKVNNGFIVMALKEKSDTSTKLVLALTGSDIVVEINNENTSKTNPLSTPKKVFMDDLQTIKKIDREALFILDPATNTCIIKCDDGYGFIGN